MKDRDGGNKNVVALITPMFCLITALTTPALAQSGTSRSSPVGRRLEELNRQGEKLERDELRRDLEGRPEKPAHLKPSQATTAQVKQDFERLQVVYNEIVLAMSASEALDYKFISVATADLRKRASRLKSNLALPQPENDEPSQKKEAEINDGQMKSLLLLLRRHISSFVTNPLFETSGPLDIELSGKASRDLKKIVELCERIRKSADQLKKADHQWPDGP
ncbi:hypothetical protein BH18ACI4_BH18ACI4_12880 [soil metagenome]